MATKKAEIRKLIRKEYRYPVLQELLAEVIYETQGKDLTGIEKRYEKLLDLLLKKPQKSIPYEGRNDDTKRLSQAAIISLNYNLDVKTACREVAKLALVPDYKFNKKIPETYTDELAQEIQSYQKRLVGKLNGKVEYYAKKSHSINLEEQLNEDYASDEVDYVLSLAPIWLSKYCKKRK